MDNLQRIYLYKKLQLLTIIIQMQTHSLQGITLQTYHVVPFDKEILKTIDFDVFTPPRLHYLVNALVHGTKLPSEWVMIRSEKRNIEKSGADKADKAVGRAPRIPQQPRRRAKLFMLPNKYGQLRPRRNRHQRRGPRRIMGNRQLIGMVPMQNPLQQPINMPVLPNLVPPSFQPINLVPPPFRPINLMPPSFQPIPVYNQAPNSQLPSENQPIITNQQLPPGFCLNQLVDQKNLDTSSAQRQQRVSKREKVMKIIPEIVRKSRTSQTTKSPIDAFKTRDPEWIALKAYKAEIRQIIQKYREEIKKDKEPIISENLKDPLPVYFQKKKASQKRRRLQKHELIKKNRKALLDIFGDAIFQRAWPISRKQIKTALGILQEEPMAVENLSEFVEMAQGNQVEPMQVEIPSNEAQIAKQGQL